MKTFYTRSVTAAVFVVVMLGAVLWSPASFFLLFLIIGIGGMREYFQLMEQIDPGYRAVSPWHRPCAYLLVPSIFFALSGSRFQFLYLPAEFLGLWLGLMLILIILINEGLFMDRLRGRNLRHSLLGLMYIALPLGLMVNMRFNDSPKGIPVLVLGIIGSLWINDTLAYLVGWQLGKTPFFPAISPKKTWEGTVGGIVLTLVAAGIYGYFGHTYSLTDWILIAAITAIFGTAGDLLESKIKRLAGVKDSGTLMPGHGGILDRFDSMLIAAPFVWVYAAFFLH